MKTATRHPSSEQPLLKESFLDSFDPDWVKKNSKYILITFGVSFLLLAALAKYFFGAELKAEKDYVAAETYFTEMKQAAIKGSKENALASYKGLKEIIAKHPELKTKYDGFLGQLLLLLNEVNEANPYLVEGIKKLEARGLSQFAALSASSQKILNNELKSAFENEKNLNDALSENSNPDLGYLKAYNLLQLAFIEMAVKNPADDQYVKDLISKLQADKNKDLPLNAMSDKFTQGEANLLDMLKTRK